MLVNAITAGKNNFILYRSFCLLATLMAFFVVILGAYTRLTDAGLGCPDWPGCYGHWLVSDIGVEEPTLDKSKAWTEMIHRYLAGFLGFIIFTLWIHSMQNYLTMRKPQQHSCFTLLSNISPMILLSVLSALAIFQALLGMWTVTLKLYPAVVMAHLLGGLLILALLWWLTLTLIAKPRLTVLLASVTNTKHSKHLGKWAIIALVVLSIQLLLGGWTSANYAALACSDFPFCQPHINLHWDLGQIIQAFRLSAAGPSKIGQPLEANALMLIHMIHRIGALVTAFILAGLAYWLLFRSKAPYLKTIGLALMLLLLTQLLLGTLNVVAQLPLSVAVAHNGVAALLLLILVTLIYSIYIKPKLSL